MCFKNVQELSEKIPFPGPIMDWKTLSRVSILSILNIRKMKVDHSMLSPVYPLGPVDPTRCRICSRKGLR